MLSLKKSAPVARRSSTATMTALVVTCEHGGNRIPAPYRNLFRHYRVLLESHRGFDPGALVIAAELARRCDAALLTSTVSRLLVDLNRSIGHQQLHMDSVRGLPLAIRQQIIDHYYQPYRTEGERLVAEAVSRCGKVIHISCHSFTNNYNGVVRQADIGLLYDPARPEERMLCAHWKSALRASAADLEVRRNFPYQGRNDGFTSALRRKFRPEVYLGIELELNQKNTLLPDKQWAPLRESVITTFHAALRSLSLNVCPSEQLCCAGTVS